MENQVNDLEKLIAMRNLITLILKIVWLKIVKNFQ